MDAARRRMLGRRAEWDGAASIGVDTLARRLDVAGASQRDFAGLLAEARAMLEAYASGANAYLASGAPLPAEYRGRASLNPANPRRRAKAFAGTTR